MEKNPNTNNLPEGFKLFTSPREFVLGMELYYGHYPNVESLPLRKVIGNWLLLLNRELNPFTLFNAPELYAYQELTNEMLWGELAWWDFPRLFEENNLVLFEVSEGYVADGSKGPMVFEYHDEHSAVFESKHPWLLEAAVYNYYEVDMTKYRTPNHPQYDDASYYSSSK